MRRHWIVSIAVVLCIAGGGGVGMAIAHAQAAPKSERPARKNVGGGEGAPQPAPPESDAIPPELESPPKSLEPPPPLEDSPPPPPIEAGAPMLESLLDKNESKDGSAAKSDQVKGQEGKADRALVDPRIRKAQTPGGDSNPLPKALERLGSSTSASSGGAGDPEGFLLPVEKLPEGRQEVGVTVDVVSPSVINLYQVATLKVVVKNKGNSEALGVVVRDDLPNGLSFVESQPITAPAGQLLVWRLGTLPAGAEKVILVKVKPTQIGAFDHSASVTIMTGGRSRTLVQEPKLKVEQTVAPSKVLKGQQVVFNIAVSNPGTGPARNVTILARLTPGLKHEQGEELKQVIALIKPGERVKLDPLYTDAVTDGEQTCEVSVASPDVAQVAPESKSVAAVTVVAPKLAIALDGPKTRYTDTPAIYRMSVSNPGTATAKNIRVTAMLPTGGTVTHTNGAQYDRYRRRLLWTIAQIEPSQTIDLSFQVRLGGVQLYQVAAEARADSALLDKKTIETDVTGIADVDFHVTERLRVVDVGDSVTYEIVIKNTGSREATTLLVSAQLSKNLESPETTGTDQSAQFNASANLVRFPAIPRLAPNDGEIVLSIKAKANEAGVATCEVFLMHDGLMNSRLAKTAATHVMPKQVGNQKP